MKDDIDNDIAEIEVNKLRELTYALGTLGLVVFMVFLFFV